jgi:hypothetical protein
MAIGMPRGCRDGVGQRTVDRDVELYFPLLPRQSPGRTCCISQGDSALDAHPMWTGDHERFDFSHRDTPAKLCHGGASGERTAGIVAEIRDEWKAVRRDGREDEWHDLAPPHRPNYSEFSRAIRKYYRFDLLAAPNPESSHSDEAKRRDPSCLGMRLACVAALDPGDGGH